MAGLSFDTQEGVSNKEANAAFKKGLNKVYGWYTGGFLAFVVVLAIAEQMGLSRGAIGIVFLIATVALYAGIGIMSRTNNAAEYSPARLDLPGGAAACLPSTTAWPPAQTG